MPDSNTWENYGVKNEKLGWGDSTESDRLFHEKERQRAEDMARKEREYEARRKEEEDRRRGY
jgi:hypothetical protein